MGGTIFVVTIVAIACATGLLKAWINKDSGNGELEENFDRLARAFVEHKKEMTERVQHLEAIIAEDEDQDNDFSQIEAPRNDNSLSNDLKSKDQVRS